jgi:hypothetical protein
VTIQVMHGDCLSLLPSLGEASIDACVTDPPYGLSFMGKNWDHGVPGIPFWRAVFCTLKPGGHLLAFGGSRTYHRLACAIEDAGFEIRDQIMWIYGSGFPKSLDVSKAIDKAAGEEGQRGKYRPNIHSRGNHVEHEGWKRPWNDDPGAVDKGMREYLPATDTARKWQGFGTALKPAHEPIVLARKPLIGTVAANVLAHGTGALNVDGCRVEQEGLRWTTDGGMAGKANPIYGKFSRPATATATATGRWPANVILSYPEDEYTFRPEITETQRRELYRWLSENP